jgi:hypothetical protein
MASRLVEAVAAGDKAGAYALLQRGQPEWPNQAVSAVERGSVAKRGQLVRMPVLSGADPSGLYLCSYSLQARRSKQGDKCTDVAVVGGAKHSSSDNNSLLADRKYCQKVDPGQKLLQFAF